jgi:hypothetical protein
MKIQMVVIDSKVLDNYIDENVVPFAVCLSINTSLTKRQQRFLEKYYDRVVDKRGWVTFYCNVINAWKCKEMGYKSIEFSDGKEEKIKSYGLEKSKSLDDKYVVVPYFSPDEKIDSVSLVKKIRLEVEKLKNKIND